MSKKLVLILALTLFGCEGAAQREATSSNAEYKVGLLFEHEGCKVYRFLDGGYRYYTNCTGSVEWTVNCGKGYLRQNQIPTQGEL